MLQITISEESAMLHYGERLAHLLVHGCVISLKGNLGVGKTTLARGILRGLGHHGAVKSPTFTIVEPYQIAERRIYHFDLYRLSDPEELEYMGIRDYFTEDSIALIEWPERGQSAIPTVDIEIQIDYLNAGQGRRLKLVANTKMGKQILNQLA